MNQAMTDHERFECPFGFDLEWRGYWRHVDGARCPDAGTNPYSNKPGETPGLAVFPDRYIRRQT